MVLYYGRNHFYGFGRIYLRDIHWEGKSVREYAPSATTLQQERCQRLRTIFSTEGCDNDSLANSITVTIRRELAPEFLSADLPTRLEDIPFLSGPVTCVHGLSRLLAACYYFEQRGTEPWWIAKVFADNLDQTDQTALAEEYSHESPRHDGLTVRSILLCSRHKDTLGENKSWARLSNSKRRDLRQLLKTNDYRRSLEQLLHWQGLWYAVHFGGIRDLLAIHCHEELLHYLNHIDICWNKIIQGLPHCVSSINEVTVSKLEGLVPGCSTTDDKRLRALLSDGTIFADLDDSHQQERIQNNIRALRTPIPSFRTFFQTVKYLLPCDRALRDLALGSLHRTTRQTLWASYSPPACVTVEHGPEDVRDRIGTSIDQDRLLGYVQLWVFVMRNFVQLGYGSTRRDKGRSKPKASREDPFVWQALGSLACRAGFVTTEARSYERSEPAKDYAKQLVQAGLVKDGVKSIGAIACLLGRQLEDSAGAGARAVRFDSIVDLGFERRFGRPHDEDYHEVDRYGLFLPVLLRPWYDTALQVSPLFFKRETLRALFGDDIFGFNFAQDTAPGSSGEHQTSDTVTPVDKGCDLSFAADSHIGAGSQTASLAGSQPDRNHDVSQEYQVRSQEDTLMKYEIAALKSKLSDAQVIAVNASRMAKDLGTQLQQLRTEKDLILAERGQLETKVYELVSQNIIAAQRIREHTAISERVREETTPTIIHPRNSGSSGLLRNETLKLATAVTRTPLRRTVASSSQNAEDNKSVQNNVSNSILFTRCPPLFQDVITILQPHARLHVEVAEWPHADWIPLTGPSNLSTLLLTPLPCKIQALRLFTTSIDLVTNQAAPTSSPRQKLSANSNAPHSPTNRMPTHSPSTPDQRPAVFREIITLLLSSNTDETIIRAAQHRHGPWRTVADLRSLMHLSFGTVHCPIQALQLVRRPAQLAGRKRSTLEELKHSSAMSNKKVDSHKTRDT